MSCEDKENSKEPNPISEVDPNRAYRELERWLYYQPRWEGLPPVLRPEDSGELICTIVYNKKEGTVKYIKPDGTPYGETSNSDQ